MIHEHKILIIIWKTGTHDKIMKTHNLEYKQRSSFMTSIYLVNTLHLGPSYFKQDPTPINTFKFNLPTTPRRRWCNNYLILYYYYNIHTHITFQQNALHFTLSSFHPCFLSQQVYSLSPWVYFPSLVSL